MEGFNHAHSSLYNVTKHAFRMWKQKWRIFQKMLAYPYKLQLQIIVALHNLWGENHEKMPHLQALAINISPLLTPPLFFLSFSWTLSPDLINLANSIHLKKKKEKQKTKIGLLLHPLFYFSVPQRPVLFCFRRLVVLGSISILSLLYLS